jgi:hypothetical protein
LTSIKRWIVDFSSPEIMGMMRKSMGTALVHAPFKFVATGGVKLFEQQGWQAEHVLSLMKEAGRLRRLPMWMRPFALLPQLDPRRTQGRWSVVAQFKWRDGTNSCADRAWELVHCPTRTDSKGFGDFRPLPVNLQPFEKYCAAHAVQLA